MTRWSASGRRRPEKFSRDFLTRSPVGGIPFSGAARGGIVLAHDFEALPSFENKGEEVADDPAFARECEHAIQTYLDRDPDIRIVRYRISINARFGPVCRADFETPNDGRDTVNRLMFWKLADGELMEFVGFEIPAPPLE